MDLQRLPYLPVHFFYFQLSAAYQRVWLAAMLVLLTAAGFWAAGIADPDRWTPSIAEIPETSGSLVAVDSVMLDYRALEVPMNAYRQQAAFSAGPMLPHAWQLVLYTVIQVLAWAVFLGAATQVRSRWVYAWYLLFALYVHSTGLFTLLIPGSAWGARGLEFGVLIVFLGLAYAFQSNWLRWELPWRVVLMGVLLGGLFGWAAAAGGWQTLHTSAGSSFPYLAFITLAAVIFVSKEPNSLLLLLATNHRSPARRLHPAFFFAAVALLVLLELVWINEYFNLGILGGFTAGIRPMQLLWISMAAAVFTSQNLFNLVRDAFSAAGAYTLALTAWMAAAAGYLWLHSASGDTIFTYTIERFAVVGFTAVTLSHAYYLAANFRPLFRQRIHFYYLSGAGQGPPLAVIWIIALAGISIGEGRDKWKTFTLLSHSYMVHLGDGALLAGDGDAAAVRYEAALQSSPVSPKAHYNLASVLVADPETWSGAMVHYRQASERYETPAARLNGAALLRLAGSRADAQALLQEGLDRGSNPYLANALALLYQQQGLPDSAIRWYQAALLEDPGLSSVYSNLALLYHDYGRPAEAKQFIDASLQGRPSDAALINAIWHSLSTGLPAALPDPETIRPKDALLSYNLGLCGLRDPRYAADRTRIKQLANDQAVPDAMLLDAYLMALDDSALYARSRAEYLMQAFPRYAPLANRLLGVCYAGKEAPELARLYLNKAAQGGDSAAALQEAYLWMHLRERDSALYTLTALRGTYPGMWKSCAKELAVLLLSVGEPVYAQTEWNLADLGPADWVRAGMLADSMKTYSIALEHFRQAIGLDSSWTAPYLEMARIYNRYGDPLASETAGYGLQIEPGGGALHLEAARAQLLQGWTDPALQSLAQAGGDEALLSRSLLLRADLALAQTDTAAAAAYLDSLARRRPLFAEGLVRLGELYARTGQSDQGNALIAAAVTVNPAHAGLWLQYARYARAWNQLEDAGFGAIKAIELSRSLQAKQEIAAEFAAEIRLAARNQN
ncbi:MAG: hypothetical protein NW241_18230 [Bacteroidia bacterium]|nr:hypothetical protein [Bacteroidia bacterium]